MLGAITVVMGFVLGLMIIIMGGIIGVVLGMPGEDRDREQHRMFRILIATCVWLDLAKDYRQQAILVALEELIRAGDLELILPRTVIDEFARNKSRVIEEGSRSLSTTLKRIKEAVDKFGDPRQKRAVLRQLDDVDHRLPTLGEAVVDMIGRIKKLFKHTRIVEISDDVKLYTEHRSHAHRIIVATPQSFLSPIAGRLSRPRCSGPASPTAP